jgi:ATP-binding protein involved in chromosome partitioning
MLTEEKVLDVLKQIIEPTLHKNLVDVNAVQELKINGNNISVKLALVEIGTPEQGALQKQVVEALKQAGADTVGLRFTELSSDEIAKHKGTDKQAKSASTSLLSKDNKTAFIAVTSGKGGVGKSTVTVNLATALARLGKRVGIIDADIYGFSVPDMMGIDERPQVVEETIFPVEKQGVKVMSMGFFVEDNAPVIWRGPMLGKMLRNFFSEVQWGELDYMILDLPPGTGDVALDVHQMLPESKEIIVTTPHSTAAFVAARAGSMAIKTNHEIIGVVENMSYYQLPDGTKDYIFGEGGGEKLAEVLKTEVIAQIPLGQPDKQDNGDQTAIYPQGTVIGEIYSRLAENIAERA